MPMMDNILKELKAHSPFTLFGALTGIILMMIFRNMAYETAHTVFYIFHPLHVFLSGIVTTGIFCYYTPREKISGINIWKVAAIGYVGSVGIGTLSDSLIPYWGEILLDMPHRHVHLGIIEHPWFINGAALIGIAIAYVKPITKHPHAGHVLISTWASLFHMLMAADHHQVSYFGVFIFLFLAVWIPCCMSDIAFPMFFVKDKDYKGCCCGND